MHSDCATRCMPLGVCHSVYAIRYMPFGFFKSTITIRYLLCTGDGTGCFLYNEGEDNGGGTIHPDGSLEKKAVPACSRDHLLDETEKAVEQLMEMGGIVHFGMAKKAIAS